MICDYCTTELLEAERDPHVRGGNLHYYCSFRMMGGSVGHQLGKCSCFGGESADPVGMTLKEGAIAAFYLNMGRYNPATMTRIVSCSGR